MKAIGKGIAISFDCDVDVELNQGGYLPVENNPELTDNFINFMKNNKQIEFIETKPAMTGEDFGYLLHKFPGTMFWLGVEDDSQLHSDTFNPKETSIEKGVKAIIQFIEFRMSNN